MRLPSNLVTGRKAKIDDSNIIPKQIAPQKWTLQIDDWMPAQLNQMQGRHWAVKHRLKKTDREIIGLAAKWYGIPTATRKRRLSVLIVLPKGKRRPDPDAYDKSLRDALVECGALKNDSADWVEGTQVEYARATRLVTFITLENM